MNNPELSRKERRALEREHQKSGDTHSFRRIALWGGTLALLGGAVGFAIYANVATPQTQTGILSEAFSTADWAWGNRDAKVVVIEYSDLQCPACAAYQPMIKQIKETFGDRIAFAFRHFPLPSHRNAEIAGIAAEAAGRQNKFWELHDTLFDRQQEWENLPDPRQTFATYAQELGMNRDQFLRDLDDPALKTKVLDQYRTGVASGVNATPTFFVNGTRIENPRSYDEFKSIIETALGS